MIGRQLDVEAEPGKRALVAFGMVSLGGRPGFLVCAGYAGWMILVGNVGKSVLSIANGPGIVVKVGIRSRRVSSALAPAGRAWAWRVNKSISGGPPWGWDGWASPCMAKQKARAARFRAFLRKNPPHFNVFSTLIQTGRSSKKIATGGRMSGTRQVTCSIERNRLAVQIFLPVVAQEVDTSV